MRILSWQIELDEDEGISILSVTLTWSNSLLSTFEESIHSYDIALCQVFWSCHYWSIFKRLNWVLQVQSYLHKFELLGGCFTFFYNIWLFLTLMLAIYWSLNTHTHTHIYVMWKQRKHAEWESSWLLAPYFAPSGLNSVTAHFELMINPLRFCLMPRIMVPYVI